MRRIFLSSLAISSACLCLGTAHAGEKLFLQTPAVYAKDAPVNADIKKDCAIESGIPTAVTDKAKRDFDITPSKTLADARGEKALALTIVNVEGGGGGAWTGKKGVTVQGTLTQNGKVIGTFNARRVSGGGAFGGYKSTCGIVDRCVKELGEDISSWLKQPRMDAKLGDM